jgi:hypothetical protein
MYNLSESQKRLLQWLVAEVRRDSLPEEFQISFMTDDAIRFDHSRTRAVIIPLSLTKNALSSLAVNQLLSCEYYEDILGHVVKLQAKCSITKKGYEAVDSNFGEPNTRHLAIFGGGVKIDKELQDRCLPILGAGSADPKLWDSAVRTACVILEERL